MSEKKTGIGWLAIGEDGAWSLGDAAEIAAGGMDQVYSLHKVTFELPDPPKVQGKDVAVTVGKAEKES